MPASWASRPGLFISRQGADKSPTRESTTARLLEVAEEAARSGVEVEVRDYIAPISDGA
jgi:hypothetical protein